MYAVNCVPPTSPQVILIINEYTLIATIAQSNYDGPYSVALQKDNFYGVQFHPEKSSKAGSQLLQNFLALWELSLP